MYEDLKTQLADKLCINSDSFDLIGITEVQFGIGQEVGREGRKDGTNAPVIKTCSSFFSSPLSYNYALHGRRVLFHQHKASLRTPNTRTTSLFLWADLSALALSVVELHPANPLRSATGAFPMESQTSQASVKAGLTGVSSAACTLTIAIVDLKHLATVLQLIE